MSKLIVELPEELHARLKQQAAAHRKTLKTIVISLLDQYLKTPSRAGAHTPTRLCGAWKDRQTAKAMIAELRSSRRWWTRAPR